MTINVFVSYSQESIDHRLRVYELVKRLRADGIHCVSDHLVKGSPPDGWRLWMEACIKESAYTLIVCTETYRRRADRQEEMGRGLGVAWEAAIITDEIYRNAARNTRFIPVIFSPSDVAHIPSWLGDVTHYHINVDDSYELLLRHLTDQPLFEEPPIGVVPKLSPITQHPQAKPLPVVTAAPKFQAELPDAPIFNPPDEPFNQATTPFTAAPMSVWTPPSEAEQRAHNDARRFARLLVSEIKLYNAIKVNDGRRNYDLYDRLKDEIDRSRKVYDKRVSPAVAARFDYFYDELVQTLAEGDPSKLGNNCPGPVVR